MFASLVNQEHGVFSPDFILEAEWDLQELQKGMLTKCGIQVTIDSAAAGQQRPIASCAAGEPRTLPCPAAGGEGSDSSEGQSLSN
jgi:hypothetical protein